MPRKKRSGIGRKPRRSANVTPQPKKPMPSEPVVWPPSPPPVTLSGLPDEVTPSQNDVSSPSSCGEYHQRVISPVEPGNIKYIDANCEMSELEDTDGFRAHEFYVITDFGVRKCNPTDDTDDIRSKTVENLYHELNTELNDSNNAVWTSTGYFKCDTRILKFVDLYDTELPGVRSIVTIDREWNVTINVHRKALPESHAVWNFLPRTIFSKDSIVDLLRTLSTCDVCVGNPDSEFDDLKPGQCEFKEENFGACNGNCQYETTFRSNQCELFINGLRCKECIKKRGALRKRRHTELHSKIDSSPGMSSRIAHSFMSPEQLKNKIDSLQKTRRSQEGKINTLRKKLTENIAKQSTIAETNNSSEIENMVRECDSLVRDQWPDENSFQRLFWEEQLKFNSCKSSNGMRWHPMIIKWCLYMKTKSTTAYNAMRDTGFIKLPSTRTLFNYSKFMPASCGISPDVVKHLRSEVKAKGLLDMEQEYKSYVGLLVDEVKIKEDLVYDRHTGELVGFIDLDKTGNQLLALEHALLDENPKLAKYMLVVMVRGACSDFKYPLACYATDGIKSELIDTIVWEAVEVLEAIVGLKVLYLTCDGASPNRRFFELHGDDRPAWYTENIMDPTRNIYFISDAPHLLKTARNCLANSGSHKKSRSLWNNGKHISWMHLVELYRDHCENRELSVLPNLTRNHIDLTAFSTMRVSLAAEIMSEKVACALERYVGPHTSETVKFIRIMNKFFDCMNTRNLSEAARTRNENKRAYTSPDDERLNWLTGEFLDYFTAWKESVNNRAGEFSKGELSAMQLSHQTLAGLKITAQSVVACVRTLLEAGAPFVLTSHFNQDVLEQLFGHFRHRGGHMENPNVKDVRHMMVEMKATRSVHMACVRGNTKRQDCNRHIDNDPLPKRPRFIR